jgi:hypothetical protein
MRSTPHNIRPVPVAAVAAAVGTDRGNPRLTRLPNRSPGRLR